MKLLKKLFKDNTILNKEGSVMSVAFIVMTILTFSLATITNTSVNLANATTMELEKTSFEVDSKALIQVAQNEFASFLLTDLTVTEFMNLDTEYNANHEQTITDIYNKYQVEIVLKLVENGDKTRIYTFKYTDTEYTDNPIVGSKTRKSDLAVTVNEDETVNLDESYSSLMDNLISSSENLNSFCLEGEDQTTCETQLEQEINTNPDPDGNMVTAELTTDIYYNSDVTLDFDTASGTLFDLNGNNLYISGNLTIEQTDANINGNQNLDVLEGESAENPSIIFVSGDFTINQKAGIEINNVLIVVQGHVYINFVANKGDVLTGSNFSIISLAAVDHVNTADILTVNDTYFKHLEYYETGDPYFFYIGDVDFATHEDISNLFANYNINASENPFEFGVTPITYE